MCSLSTQTNQETLESPPKLQEFDQKNPFSFPSAATHTQPEAPYPNIPEARTKQNRQFTTTNREAQIGSRRIGS
jgi:hypothetical protein